MVRKYIPIPINEQNKFNEPNYLDKYIRDNFCKYIFKKGIYEGKQCNISCYKGGDYCKKHFNLLEKKKDTENKRNNIRRCIYVSKIYNNCNRKCIENQFYCRNHKSLCKDEKEEININNLQNISIENKKLRNKKKKLRYKNNKKLRKQQQQKYKEKINNYIFDYNKILKNKCGLLFKEENIYYTYNLYEKKVKADIIKGIECTYCGFTRYTNSGPCIYANCINRSFGDEEFKLYYKINNKELISIYNKRIKC